MKSLEYIVSEELNYFDYARQRKEFISAMITPEKIILPWQYDEEKHECFIIAKNNLEQILFCKSGFGPNFSWSVTDLAITDFGVDSDWYAYLYEAFIMSSFNSRPKPKKFELMGPGERDNI